MFDFVRFCDEGEIPYKTSGNNVTEGWININCPFCNDPSEHLGFDPATENLNCWRCGKHDLLTLLRELADASPFGIIKQYQTGDTEIERPLREEREKPASIDLPPEAYKPTHSLREGGKSNYAAYLKKRGFDPEHIMSEWNIYAGGYVGEYKCRLIIPVYYNHNLVSYTGRDITGEQEPPYRHLEGVDIKNYLYGYDHCHNTVIVVEGVTDVWRIGKGIAVATFGIKYTMAQLCLLKKFNKVGVLFDVGEQAQEEAEKIVNALTLVGVDAHNLALPKGIDDPAELSNEEARKIAKIFV